MHNCPFCNRQHPKKQSQIPIFVDQSGYSVYCAGCGARGPSGKTKKEARGRWNSWKKTGGARIDQLESVIEKLRKCYNWDRNEYQSHPELVAAVEEALTLVRRAPR